MEPRIIPIGLDPGNSMHKTVHGIYPTAITEIDHPFSEDKILELGGQYYRTHGKRIDVREDKTGSDAFRLLSYPGIAMELDRIGVKKARIYLGVGCPIGRLAKERLPLIKYYSNPKEVRFRYSGKAYSIIIEKVLVFPECYGAVVDRIPTMKSEEVVVDIGSWTIDILKIIDHSPDESQCGSDSNGLIPCMRKIDEECLRLYNTKIGENIIRDVLVTGRADIDNCYIEVIEKELTRYTTSVFRSLREMGINTRTSPVTFVGGGAALMRRYAGITAKNISFIDDIRANAKGYDMLVRAYLKSNGIPFR